MKSEKDIQDVYNFLTKTLIIPDYADWNLPNHNLSFKYNEVCTAIRVLKWILTTTTPPPAPTDKK
jgi:hypothetical protein